MLYIVIIALALVFAVLLAYNADGRPECEICGERMTKTDKTKEMPTMNKMYTRWACPNDHGIWKCPTAKAIFTDDQVDAQVKTKRGDKK